MLLKELLSLRNLSTLEEGCKVYNIELPENPKKKDLVEELAKVILDDDYFMLNLLRLTSKERQLIKNSPHKKINITNNNIANIVNLDSYLFGLVDDNSYVMAEEVVSKYLELSSDSNFMQTLEIMHDLNEVLAFCANFYGIFNLAITYELFKLNPKYKEYSLKDFVAVLEELNKVLHYYELDNNEFIALVAKKGNLVELRTKQAAYSYYKPSLKEINEYYTKHYLESKEIKENRKLALENHSVYETELYLRMLYNICMQENNKDDGASLIKLFFAPQTEEDINNLAEIFVYTNSTTRKMVYRGHRLIDILNKSK